MTDEPSPPFTVIPILAFHFDDASVAVHENGREGVPHPLS